MNDEEYEIGRYQQKQKDDAELIKDLRKKLEEADKGLKYMSLVTDAINLEIAKKFGRKMKHGFTFKIPRPDVDNATAYLFKTERSVKGIYTVTCTKRKVGKYE